MLDWLGDFLTGPRRIGDYRIVAKINEGGTGIVYRAQLARGKRPSDFALKTLRLEYMNCPDKIKRLGIEAEALKLVNHPNVVRFHDLNEDRATGQWFLVMEYIEGGMTLAHYLERHGSLPLAKAIALLIQIASAIQEAHRLGVIHRDIKPANILMDRGIPKVTDFLAKRIRLKDPPSDGITGANETLGTPAYMPPEQQFPRIPIVGKPSDVYALGCVLYEVLTGQRAFANKEAAMAPGASPVPLRKLRPEIPVALEELCLRCLSTSQAARPTTKELIDELQQMLPLESSCLIPADLAAQLPVDPYGEGSSNGDRVASNVLLGRGEEQSSGKPRRANTLTAVMGLIALVAAGFLAANWLGQRRDPNGYVVQDSDRPGNSGAIALKEEWKSLEAINFTNRKVILPESTYEHLNGFVKRCETAVKSEPGDRELAVILGTALLKQAAACTLQVQLEKASVAARHAQRVFADAPAPELSDELARSCRAIAFLSLVHGDPDAEAASKAVSYRNLALAGPPVRPSAAIELFHDRMLLVTVLRRNKQYGEAAKVRDQAVTELDRSTDVADRAHYHEALTSGFLLLGIDSDVLNQPEKARQYYLRSLDESTKLRREVIAFQLSSFRVAPIPDWRQMDDLALLIPAGPSSDYPNYRSRRTNFFIKELEVHPDDLNLSHIVMRSTLNDVLCDPRDAPKEIIEEFDRRAQKLLKREIDAARLLDIAEAYSHLAFIALLANPDRPPDTQLDQFLGTAIELLEHPSVRSLPLDDNLRLIRATTYVCRALKLSAAPQHLRDANWAMSGISYLNEAASNVWKVTALVEWLYPIFEPVVTNRFNELLSPERRNVDEAKILADRVTVFSNRGLLPVSGSLLYNVACAYAVASEASSSQDKNTLAEKAMSVLSQAFNVGFDPPLDSEGNPRYLRPFGGRSPFLEMRKDSDLDSLRSRDDYKKFEKRYCETAK